MLQGQCAIVTGSTSGIGPGIARGLGPAALPGMKARNWGRIVNIASTHRLAASVEKSAYADAAAHIRSAAVPVGGAWLAQ